MKILILLLILFFYFNSAYSNEKNLSTFTPSTELPLTKKEFKKIIKKSEEIKRSKEKEFDWSSLKPFVHLIFLGCIIAFFMSRKKDEANDQDEMQGNINDFMEIDKNKKSKKKNKIENFVEKHNRLNQSSEIERLSEAPEEEGSLAIYVDYDTAEKQNTITVFGKGTVNIKSNKLKDDNSKAKIICYVLDITEEKNPIYLKCTDSNFNDEDTLLCSSREMEIPDHAEYYEWSRIALFPSQLVVPPKKGKRKLIFKLFFSNLNAKFEMGVYKKNKNSEIYIERNSEFEIDYKEPGFLETKEFADDVNKNIIQLGMALANTDGHIKQEEVDIIKNWTKNQYGWNIFDFFNNNRNLGSLSLENENEKKAELSFLISSTYDQLKDKRLSMSKIIEELNEKATSAQKYESMKLLLDIAGSDDKLGIAEDTLLNKTAKALYLDLKHFQEMKSLAIANISNIEHSETMDETVFNLTEDMSKSEKCKRLREEYSKWNRQTNNSNEGIRGRAKKMVDLAASLRKKYDC